MDDSAQFPKSETSTDDIDGRTVSGPKHPHDSEGHFIHKETQPITNNQSPITHANPITKFLHDETAVHKSNGDELIDVHIGNPLRKITELLQEIKRQKAFSFTLKGSLGVMGVVLVAGTFGILGGSKALCDKGTQTKIGTIKTLSFQEEEAVSILNDIPVLNMLFKKPTVNRTILISPTNETIHLVLKNKTSPPSSYQLSTLSYYTTGNFDSCSQTLTVSDQTALQPAQ